MSESKSESNWESDSESEGEMKTPERRSGYHNLSDSGSGTPDSPIVWDYLPPVVDQKTREAAEKLGSSLRKWKRENRRNQQSNSPIETKRSQFYRAMQLRLAALAAQKCLMITKIPRGDDTSDESIDASKYEGDEIEKKDFRIKENEKSADSGVDGFFNDEDNFFFLQVDLKDLPDKSNHKT